MKRATSLRRGFTLVELLVVIGIIAVLIGVLLPVLSSARKSAEKATCLASLRQIGDAFKLYQHEYKGAWPAAVHNWMGAAVNGVAAGTREKRWHDYVGKYLIGSQKVKDKNSGQEYVSTDVNFNGTMDSDALVGGYANHGEFGTTADPVWIGTLRDRKSVLWGCPSWSRFSQIPGSTQYDWASNNGYAMNIFTYAPNDAYDGKGFDYGVAAKKTCALRTGVFGETPFVGEYHKYTSWKSGAERALIFDGVHNGGFFAAKWWNTAAAPPADGYDVLNASVTLPEFPTQNWPIDWNRHSKAKPGKVKASDLTFNMLFCDGHAAPVSARDAYKAIRFR
jgi:prepilin-type N-terminal cleavage/methylation domain-containing protein/prepilin-type processing-associated H-X9-DG protein